MIVSLEKYNYLGFEWPSDRVERNFKDVRKEFRGKYKKNKKRISDLKKKVKKYDRRRKDDYKKVKKRIDKKVDSLKKHIANFPDFKRNSKAINEAIDAINKLNKVAYEALDKAKISDMILKRFEKLENSVRNNNETAMAAYNAVQSVIQNLQT